MSITLLDPPTSLEAGVLTKSTALRIQFAVEADSTGGQLNISASGAAGSTSLAALMGGQTLHATALLKLFKTPVPAGTEAAVGTVMQDVQVTSVSIASGAASVVEPLSYEWFGDLGGTIACFLQLSAPTSGAGGVWIVIIELRNTLIG